jgi:ubiquinone/menaquinone biosynthesis C-methylase UbiE
MTARSRHLGSLLRCYDREVQAGCEHILIAMPLGDRLFAALYDPLGARWEEKHGAALRRQLLADARGRVLELGVGTGLTLSHYPEIDELVGVDPSEPMLRRARARAAELGREVTLVQAPAEELPFEDASFDTVITMAVLCTVRDPDRALAEVRRVLRPGGQFIFAEHVRAADPKLARWQDRLERPWGFFAGGCHPNRRTLETIESAGFEVRDLEHGQLPGLPKLIRPSVRGTAVAD